VTVNSNDATCQSSWPSDSDGSTAVFRLSRVRPCLINRLAFGLIGLGWTLAGNGMTARSAEPEPVPAADEQFETIVAPFLARHCNDCHGGDAPEADLSLTRFGRTAEIQDNYDLWERVSRMIEHREMPPADVPQPSEESLQAVLVALRGQLDSFDCSGESRPGRVTVRRLNRVEYNHTVRDLFGIDFRPADDFPSDDVGYGFDNIADVLSMSPILLEKYLASAEQIVAQVFEDPETRKRVEIESAKPGDGWAARLRSDVSALARRAFRRPVDEEEVDRLLAIAVGPGDRDAGPPREPRGRRSGFNRYFREGRSTNQPLRIAATAILASPHFLFRIELDPEVSTEAADSGSQPDPDQPAIRPLNDHEVASRLSYFLWSSMPDAVLFELADEGKLRHPEVLEAQVDRMLNDPKASALVDHFAGQWLQLRDLELLSPDPQRYPAFDDTLRKSMRQETEKFFEAVIREDRSVLDFLDADYSFVNERLAKHYGMEGVEGDEFRRVELPPQRRGVLTQASILTLTSNPTRTSPVKRGQWILDNFLGEPPPPPPAGVEELNEDDETLGSLRERMEQHRANPACAVCHRQMDTLGFGLENFDGVGGWRDVDGRFPIDPSGELPGNVQFSTAAEMLGLLSQGRRDAFARRLTEKLLTYSLGRGLGPFDRCSVNGILDRLADDEYRFRTLVKAVVTSDPFLYRELTGAP